MSSIPKTEERGNLEKKVKALEEEVCSRVAAVTMKKATVEKISVLELAESPKTQEDSQHSSTELPIPAKQSKKIPIVDPIASLNKPVNVPVPMKLRLPTPKESLRLDLRPVVLATHLVPSLPIGLFETLAMIIEAATNTPTVLLHESRLDRPVAEDIVDIAFIAADKEWTTGVLLPIGLVFEHRFNKNKKPGVYADIIIARDVSSNVEDILDLRGYKCAIPNRYRPIGAAGLLFNHLKSKGENPTFFGNTLDSDTQVAALQMVAGKQAEVGVLEAPVINCHKYTLPGVNSLLVLDSLGPLPPYQIMVNKKLPDKQQAKIVQYLLNLDEHWIKALKPFGCLGFAEYSKENYEIEEIKSAVTSVPYY